MTERRKILVVDDEEPLRIVLSRELELDGYEASTASDGEEALMMLENERFDMVFLDIKMPRVDGFEVLRVLTQRWPKTIVVMLTGLADLSNAITCAELGADDFVSKPYDLVDLLATVEQLLKEEPNVRERNKLVRRVSLLEDQLKSAEAKNELMTRELGGGSFNLSSLYSLVAGSAHSLKSELTNISAAASELRQLGRHSPEIIEQCEMIFRSAQFAQLQLRRMIDFTKRSRVQRVAIEVTDIVLKMKELINPRLPSNIQLDWIVNQDLINSRFLADREETFVVLTELVNNSVSALRGKGGTIQVSFEAESENVRISVADNGPGIPSGMQRLLLSKRVDSKTGLGIGLYLCSRIVKSMGGALSFHSEEGKGASFSLLLPLEKSSKEA